MLFVPKPQTAEPALLTLSKRSSLVGTSLGTFSPNGNDRLGFEVLERKLELR